MMLTVADIAGLTGMPTSLHGVRKWLTAHNVPTVLVGKRFQIELSDLPDETRHAYIAKLASEHGIPPGDYDDAAHSAFLKAPTNLRAKAERRAAMALLLVSIREHVGWPDRIAVMRRQFGKNGTSIASLKRLLKDVKDVDPVNYAPALLARYGAEGKRADISEQAWSFFMTLIRDAAPDFPIIQAWRDVRNVSQVKGWDWPSYVTVNNHWKALSKVQRSAARYGRSETAKEIALPAHRDKTTIAPLAWVSLDGRTLDFWTITEGGKAVRLTMLALVDVGSNMVLDYELATSENAVGTVKLIKRTCETYGIFDRLYTDNGSAFAGHLVAGGTPHKFRDSKSLTKGVRPFGICYQLGINIHFALPGNAQAKIAERTFATLSRVIDDRPEFKNAHAGHNPGAAPDKNVAPVAYSLAENVIRREVKRHNDEAGRRSQGANGRSYSGMFYDGLSERIVRKPTARQLYLASLIYVPVAVNKRGQIVRDHWVYGGPSTQAELLEYHGDGQRILLGRDPDDLTAPAIAFDPRGNLICEGIDPIERGDYESVGGIKEAASNRKAARRATAEAEAANNYASDQAFEEALKALDAITPAEQNATPKPAKVVGARFGAPLREHAPIVEADEDQIPTEFWENFDTHTASKGGGGKAT